MARRLVVAVVLLLAIAGCGGDPQTDPSPTKSTSPVSTTPSPSPPPMPDAAKANTKAGAIAFVRHYIELINYAQATGDLRALADVEAPSCESCANARNALKTIYDAGGSIKGGNLTFDVTSVSPSQRYKGWLVSGALRFAPETVIRKQGEPPEQLTGGTAPVNALVGNENSAHQWRVVDWTRGS